VDIGVSQSRDDCPVTKGLRLTLSTGTFMSFSVATIAL